MGREIRMVPADWQHPQDGFYRDGSPRYVSLFGGSFANRLSEYLEEKAKWDRGEFPDWCGEDSRKMSYEEWNGGEPKKEDYMPDWPAEQRTHLMMYETCSEGSPISPAFKTPEELARWLDDNNASAFGSMTATYEQWLATCNSGFAMSAVIASGKVVSGVEFLSSHD